MHRHQVKISTHIVLQHNDKVLLGLRKSAEYPEGIWGLVAGHLEQNESVITATIREVLEEIGVTLARGDLQLSLVMHGRKPEYIGFFFSCANWHGEIINLEPEKCLSLQFFDYNLLPSNTIPYVRQALSDIRSGIMYKEIGWD